MIGLILCAGKGTRLKEETKDKPKCMVQINGKTVLEHIAGHMNKYGIWRIVVNLHAFPEVVMKHFGQRFLYLYEPVPMGEFATISIIRGWFPEEKIVVMNGDTLTDINLTAVGNMKNDVRFISKKTKRHMGTSLASPYSEIRAEMEVDCVYHDIGTPSKLAIARKYYAN